MHAFNGNRKQQQPQTIAGRIEIKTAIKIAVAGSLGWFLGIWFSHVTQRPDSLVSGTWCALTAIVVLQTNLGGTYQSALYRFLGVLIGSFMGGLCTVLLGSHPLSLGVSIVCTVVLCSILNIKESIRIACMSVAIVMILWGIGPKVSPWVFAFFRLIDSLFGILIALAVAHLLWPFQAARKLRINVAHVLFRLSQLLRLINGGKDKIVDPIEKEEFWNHIKEVDMLLEQDRDYLDEVKLELLMQPERLELWAVLHNELEELFKLILGLRRVHERPKKLADSLLSKHVDNMYTCLDKALQHMAHQLTLRLPVGSLPDLAEALSNLEEDLERFRNSHSTRKFSLPDVEGFFVFFYSMKHIVEEVAGIAQKVDELYGKKD